ncbi:FBP domain-containing protein [Actinoplanes sp. CA-030573]|uniref:FBP domain-containing protein n=1 Tax=Actinoplanes sp. CA-030573 TaxID=3239898 RepID=UPI003D8BAECB
MEPLTEPQIRGGLANCSKGEAGRIKLPDLAAVPWRDLDFLGWTDPGAPQRAVIVMPDATGIVLRRPESRRTSALRSSMCRVCYTGHSSDGVTLFVAPLAGASGRQGNTVGEYICSDLACSLYLRGKRQPRGRLVRQEETLTLDERVDRAMTNLNGFVKRVLAG